MNHIEKLTRYTAGFIDELVRSGLGHVVISPGSRSTPLAVLCRQHPKLKEWILVDERSAAYFALGIARRTNTPVALVCTSGTAAANYYPAIIEAYYARVPLIVLTADRPHELRGIGAPQTIKQMHMYGDYVKDFQEMALPDALEEMLQYVRNRAARAVRIAEQDNQGPVHVNFPFREPLMPDLLLENLWGDRNTPYNPYSEGKKQLNESALQWIADIMTQNKNGLFVCGPQVEEGLAMAIVQLGERLAVPILTDPLSQVRAGSHSKENLITTYDAVFKNKEIREALKPDYIIRFGAMPISKSYRFFIEDHCDSMQFIVEHNMNVREPTNHHSEYIFADSVKLCEDLLSFIQGRNTSSWLEKWRTLEKQATNILMHTDTSNLTEGEAVRTICECLPYESDLFIANSMPVRDLDTFLFPTDKDIFVYGNRGASGIDGITSTALGMAAVSKRHVTLIIGDLSFYHDLNGLFAAKHYQLPLTVILLNNNGGGIFSFLPQAKDGTHFEALFGTPLHMDFEKVVTMYGGNFTRLEKETELEQELINSYQRKGLNIIEIVTNREENLSWHQELWAKIAEKVAGK